MEASAVALLIIAGIIGLLVLFTVLGSFFTIQTQQAAVIQRFGKFERVATAGLNFKYPWIDSIVALVDLRMLGLAMRSQPSAVLARTLAPWTMVGIALVFMRSEKRLENARV